MSKFIVLLNYSLKVYLYISLELLKLVGNDTLRYNVPLLKLEKSEVGGMYFCQKVLYKGIEIEIKLGIEIGRGWCGSVD